MRRWSRSARVTGNMSAARWIRTNCSTSRTIRTSWPIRPDPAHAATLSRFRSMADTRWDLGRFDAEVRESQAQRRVVYEALRKGAYHAWDYQPQQNAVRAVYAQSHEPRHPGGLEALSTGPLDAAAPTCGATRRRPPCRCRGHHQHSVALAEHFVIEVDAYDGVGPDAGGTLLQSRERDLPGSLQFLLIGSRAATDDVPDACEEVLEDVGAEYGFAGGHAAVLDDFFPFNVRGGRLLTSAEPRL